MPEDLDFVVEGDAVALAQFLYKKKVSTIPPVIYPQFGTAMVMVQGVRAEFVTARKESYRGASRKPEVEPGSLLDDAMRRDFTVNSLLRRLDDDQIIDPLGVGLADLEARLLRTPSDPNLILSEDPLRMLRAVRFKHQLGATPVPEVWQAIQANKERLSIISAERIRDELLKMLLLPAGPDCLEDLRQLGLLELIAPELVAMEGVEQGHYHHLDVWHHTLLVMKNAGHGDLVLTLACLLHDVGKPETKMIQEDGRIRFFGHEAVGASLTGNILRRLKFSNEDIERVMLLVKNHMRLGSTEHLTTPAARRLVRDLGPELDRLLALTEADANGLKQGVRRLDLLPIREKIEEVRGSSSKTLWESPLSGSEIMALTGVAPGPLVGKLKEFLAEKVIEGQLEPNDFDGARAMVLREARNLAPPSTVIGENGARALGDIESR
jgi:poly(A) polymerase